MNTQSSARVGKIARLPESIRAQLNDRLRDGQPGRLILPWLNSLPEVRQVLDTLFAGKPINHANLSAWRNGGFAEDNHHRQAARHFKELLTFAAQLGQDDHNPLAQNAPQSVGRRCSDALTSPDHTALTQGAAILATARLFELLSSGGDMDFPLLQRVIACIVRLRRTEIAQQNAGIRRDNLKLREELQRPQSGHSGPTLKSEEASLNATLTDDPFLSLFKPIEADLHPINPATPLAASAASR